jgi:hypothetical protein
MSQPQNIPNTKCPQPQNVPSLSITQTKELPVPLLLSLDEFEEFPAGESGDRDKQTWIWILP